MDPIAVVNGQFELAISNGQTQQDSGLVNAIVMSLFGGNLDGSIYWGFDTDSTENTFQLALATSPSFEADIPALTKAALDDLSWLVVDNIADEIDVRIAADGPRRMNIWIAIQLTKDASLKIFKFNENGVQL